MARKFTTRKRWGGAVLEMALAAPILVMLSFGTVEYGYYIYVKNEMYGAASNGAGSLARHLHRLLGGDRRQQRDGKRWPVALRLYTHDQSFDGGRGSLRHVNVGHGHAHLGQCRG